MKSCITVEMLSDFGKYRVVRKKITRMNDSADAAASNPESVHKKQDISDEKNLVVSFIQFLRQRISREQCTTDQVEGIEGCYILL